MLLQPCRSPVESGESRAAFLISLAQPSWELKAGLESAGRGLPCQSWMLWGSTEGQMTRALCE